jgi:hypothetical protein
MGGEKKQRLLENTRRRKSTKAIDRLCKKKKAQKTENACITPYSCTEKKRDVCDMRRGAGEKI